MDTLGRGADNRTWTCTEESRLEPESTASANSAISAYFVFPVNFTRSGQPRRSLLFSCKLIFQLIPLLVDFYTVQATEAELFAKTAIKKRIPLKESSLVRETGLEPVRDYHTPLKRARLPIPPLSHIQLCPSRNDWYYIKVKHICQHFFSIYFINFHEFFKGWKTREICLSTLY